MPLPKSGDHTADRYSCVCAASGIPPHRRQPHITTRNIPLDKLSFIIVHFLFDSIYNLSLLYIYERRADSPYLRIQKNLAKSKISSWQGSFMLTDKPLNLNQAERISRKFIVEFRFHLDVALLRKDTPFIPISCDYMQTSIHAPCFAETVFQAR